MQQQRGLEESLKYEKCGAGLAGWQVSTSFGSGGGGVVEKSQSFDVLGVCHAAKQITEE